MGTSLEDLLSDSPPSHDTPPSPDPAPAPAVPEVEASSDPASAPAPSAAAGQDAPADPPKDDQPAEPQGDDKDGTGQTNDGPPPSPGAAKNDSDDPKVRAFQKKAQDETRKRQELEKQLKDQSSQFEALQKQIADLTARMQPAVPQQRGPQPSAQRPAPQTQPQRGQQPRRPPPPNPDVDPGAAIRYLNSHWQSELQRRDQEVAERELKRTIETSQAIARLQYTDYEEMENVFADEADKNPALYAEMQRHPSPAHFAYDMGRRFKALREVGDDPLAWKSQQEEAFNARLAEERKKWEEEAAQRQSAPSPAPAPQRQPAAPQRPAPPSPPPSLAGATSAAPRNPGTRFEGPTPLEKLLG